jgi:hypothetical protein
MDVEHATVNLRIARHLMLMFQDIDWRWSRLTLDELQIYPNQQAVDAVHGWVTQTIHNQEAFRSESLSVKSSEPCGIITTGNTEKKKMSSKSVRILDAIKDSDGMRFRDIQKLLWYMNNDTPFTRDLRGYWCTNLCGSWASHPGLLAVFCVKGNDGLWRRNNTSHEGKPWSVVNQPWMTGAFWK